jgi:hypothetical protein
MWGIWLVQQRPSSLGPFGTEKRNVSPGKPTNEFKIQNYAVLNGLKDYGYAGIDDSSKVRHLLKGIKSTEPDVFKTQMMDSPSLRDDFEATVELYSTLIKQMKLKILN